MSKWDSIPFRKLSAIICSVVLLSSTLALSEWFLPIVALHNGPAAQTSTSPTAVSTLGNPNNWKTPANAFVNNEAKCATTTGTNVVGIWRASLSVPNGATIHGVQIIIDGVQSNSGGSWKVYAGTYASGTDAFGTNLLATPIVSTECSNIVDRNITLGGDGQLWGLSGGWDAGKAKKISVKVDSGLKQNSKKIDIIYAKVFYTLDNLPPETSAVSVSPVYTNGKDAGGNTKAATVSATVTDKPDVGFSGVAAAEFFIDKNPGSTFGFASDGTTPGKSMSLALGSDPFGSKIVNVAGSIDIRDGSGNLLLTETVHTAKVRGKDGAGNVETTGSTGFLVDGTPPETSIPTLNLSELDINNNSRTATFTVTVTDNSDGVTVNGTPVPSPTVSCTVQSFVNGVPTGDPVAVSLTGNSGTFNVPSNVDQVLRCNSTDAAGNKSGDASITVRNVNVVGSQVTNLSTNSYLVEAGTAPTTIDGPPVTVKIASPPVITSGVICARFNDGTDLNGNLLIDVGEVGGTVTFLNIDCINNPVTEEFILKNSIGTVAKTWNAFVPSNFGGLNNPSASTISCSDANGNPKSITLLGTTNCVSVVVTLKFAVGSEIMQIVYSFGNGIPLTHTVILPATGGPFTFVQSWDPDADTLLIEGTNLGDGARIRLTPTGVPYNGPGFWKNNNATATTPTIRASDQDRNDNNVDVETGVVGKNCGEALDSNDANERESSCIKLGNFIVDAFDKPNTVADALGIFDVIQANTNNAYDSLAGHLLAAEFNVVNGVNNCAIIDIYNADRILASANQAPGTWPNAGYAGPSSLLAPVGVEKDVALALKNKLANFHTNGCGIFTLNLQDVSRAGEDPPVFPVVQLLRDPLVPGDPEILVASEQIDSQFSKLIGVTSVVGPNPKFLDFEYGPYDGGSTVGPYTTYTGGVTTEDGYTEGDKSGVPKSTKINSGTAAIGSRVPDSGTTLTTKRYYIQTKIATNAVGLDGLVSLIYYRMDVTNNVATRATDPTVETPTNVGVNDCAVNSLMSGASLTYTKGTTSTTDDVTGAVGTFAPSGTAAADLWNAIAKGNNIRTVSNCFQKPAPQPQMIRLYSACDATNDRGLKDLDYQLTNLKDWYSFGIKYYYENRESGKSSVTDITPYEATTPSPATDPTLKMIYQDGDSDSVANTQPETMICNATAGTTKLVDQGLTKYDAPEVSQPTQSTASTSITFTYAGITGTRGSPTVNGGTVTFECSLDNAAFSSCLATGITYSNLALGSHTFKVRASNSGIPDSTPAAFTWTKS